MAVNLADAASRVPPAGADEGAGIPGAGLFGRADEQRALSLALDAALAGRSRILLIGGDPGIGKSRLVEGFVAEVATRGVPVQVGRCHDSSGAPAYWPWLQVVRAQALSTAREQLQEQLGVGVHDVAQWVPEVGRRLGVIAPSAAQAESEYARFRLFDSIAGYLLRAASPAGMVIVLEDLHWADRASLLLLEFIAASVRTSRLLIIGTHREQEMAETVSDLLRRMTHAERRTLSGLAPPDVAALLAALAGGELPPRVVRDIVEETEGNPFFVGEIFQHLLERRLLVRDGERWGVQETMAQLPLPDSVREVIERRLQHLGTDCVEGLQVAAVLGRGFAHGQLEALTGRAPEQVRGWIDEAVAARVVQAHHDGGGETAFHFAHALIREALYRSIERRRRMRLHQYVGDALAAPALGDADGAIAERAHHYYEAAELDTAARDRALRACREAAEQAMGALGFEDAVRQFKRALRLLAVPGGADAGLRTRLLLGLAEALRRAGDSRQARTRYLEAADLAATAGAAELLARSALGLGMVNFGASWWAGLETDPTLVGLLKRARRALGDHHPALRGGVAARLTLELYWSAAFEFCGPLAEEANRHAASQVGTPEAALAVAAQSYSRLGPDGTGEDYHGLVLEAVRLAEASGKPDLRLNIHVLHFLGVGNWCPDRDWFDEQVRTYHRIAAELREPQHRWFGEILRFTQTMFDGDLRLAEQVATGARDLAEAVEDRNGAMIWGAQIGITRYFQNRAAELEAGFRGFAARYPAIPGWAAAVALSLADGGRQAEARDLLDQFGTRDFVDLRRDTLWFNGMSMFALAALGCGHTHASARLYEQLAPYADRYVMVPPGIGSRGPVTYALAALALALGRIEDALRHAEDAIEAAQRMRDLPFELYSQALLAAAMALDRTRTAAAAALLARVNAQCDLRGIARLSERPWWQPRLRELAQARGMTPEMDAFLGVRVDGRSLRRRQRRKALLALLAWPARRWETVQTRLRLASIGLLGRWVSALSDRQVEHRFGRRWVQRLLFGAMAQSFQPRHAFGFRGDIGYELTFPHRPDRSALHWTLRIDARKVRVLGVAPACPAVQVRMSVTSMMRILVGQIDAVAAMIEGLTEVRGDLAVASRLVDMFGGVSPVGDLRPGDLQRTHLAGSRQVRELLSDLDIAPADIQLSLQAKREAMLQRRLKLSVPIPARHDVTILVSDMENFSRMTETLGDSRAFRLMQEHNRIVRRHLSLHSGYEIELQGDSFLLAFTDRTSALGCACAVQRDLAEYNRRHPDQPIRIRIGMHTGEAIKDTGKYFGKTMIVASRISAQAAAGEVLATESVYADPAIVDRYAFGALRVFELKGLAGEYAARALLWDRDRMVPDGGDQNPP